MKRRRFVFRFPEKDGVIKEMHFYITPSLEVHAVVNLGVNKVFRDTVYSRTKMGCKPGCINPADHKKFWDGMLNKLVYLQSSGGIVPSSLTPRFTAEEKKHLERMQFMETL